jgi:Zn-dependent protease
VIVNALLRIGVLLFAVSFHESAHAWTANRFGDDTARLQGRISLNPLVHIDVVGTILVPVILAVTTNMMFGWAKPVPVNPLNLRPYRKGLLWVSAAGPLSNFLLMGISIVVLYILYFFTGSTVSRESVLVPLILLVQYSVIINCILGVFNMMPVFPLDGSKILLMLLPAERARQFESLQPYGPILLLLLLFTGVYRIIFYPFILILDFLLPGLWVI